MTLVPDRTLPLSKSASCKAVRWILFTFAKTFQLTWISPNLCLKCDTSILFECTEKELVLQLVLRGGANIFER